MLVPETKSVYIQTRHEIGREWACVGCDTPENATWAPVSGIEHFQEFVIYDTDERESEAAMVMGFYYEDVFPQVANTSSLCESYYNELMVYTDHFSQAEGGLLESIPMEVVHRSGDTDISLGIISVGCTLGRKFFSGLGGREYPINIQKGDKLLIKPLIIDGDDLLFQNSTAASYGHDALGVWPVYGHFPADGGNGLYDWEEWARRLFLNVILDATETRMVETAVGIHGL